MKKILLILFVFTVLAAATGGIIGATACYMNGADKGSGEIITKIIDAPQFHAIDASRAVKVVISDQLSDKIRIDADDNIIEYVVVRNDNGELNITIDKLLNHYKTNITVTVPANGKIRSLEASSAARITSNTPLSATQFDIEASSAAHITVDITATRCSVEASSAAGITAKLNVEECTVKLSSASKADLSGLAKQLNANLNSASKLYAQALIATKAQIETSSGSNAQVNCSEVLRAEASSGSSIRYTGTCQPSIRTSSGGNIRSN